MQGRLFGSDYLDAEIIYPLWGLFEIGSACGLRFSPPKKNGNPISGSGETVVMPAADVVRRHLEPLVEPFLSSAATPGEDGLPEDRSEITRRMSASGVEKLMEEFPNHRWVMTTIIQETPAQKGSLDVSSAAVWDADRDCVFNFQFDGKTLQCIVVVVAMSSS